MKRKLLVFICLFLINACSSDKNIVINKQLDNDVKVYNSGLELLKKKKFDESIDRFTELEIQYPYSDWSARGQMLIGFAHYSNKEYDEAILSLSKGSKALVYIPSRLGYGENGVTSMIPPNCDLVFEIELIDIMGNESSFNNIDQLYLETRYDESVANYLFNNMEKEHLEGLANVINQGLLKKECGFNDCLLFLSKMVNNKKFVENIKKITTDCLSNDKKTIKTYHFFKNNLLNSKIWSIPAEDESTNKQNTNVNNDEHKLDTDIAYDMYIDTTQNYSSYNYSQANDEKQKTVSKSVYTLFDEIKTNVLLDEFINQQKFIKDEICKMEKEFNEEFEHLTNKIEYHNLLLNANTKD